MTVTTRPQTAGGSARVGADSRPILVAATVAAGAGLGFAVGRDGSLPWQVARVLAVAAAIALVVLGLRRLHHGRRAAVAFTAGLLTLPVGLGIGVRHLTKAGIAEPVTVAGLLTLAGGVVLLVAGTVGLVRAARSWRRVVVLPALLVIVLVVTWPLCQALAATNVPPTAVRAATPADRGLGYTDVTFTTADGALLSGWYLPSDNAAAVVLLLGAGSTRSGVLDHAAVLARHGYGVLVFDARGHGRSEGRGMDFGWYGDQDIAAAVSYLQTRPDVDAGHIAAVGMSMGGEEAIGAAAADPRIRAVVAEGATNRVAGDKAWLSEVYGWRGTLTEGIDRVLYGTTDLLTAAEPPTTLRDAVAAAAPRPVLLIAGGSLPTEAHACRYIQGGSPDTVQLWVAPDIGHTQALGIHPRQWERRVTAFLADALDVAESENQP